MTKERNLQEDFNTMYLGVIAQGKPSVIDSGANIKCMYRHPDGLRCAAGFLIPDDEYRPDMEGSCASSVVAGAGAMHDDMQNAHDYAARSVDFVERFMRYAEMAAKDYGLTIPETTK